MANPKNTTERSMSMAELLCLGIESTRGAKKRKKRREHVDYDQTIA